MEKGKIDGLISQIREQNKASTKTHVEIDNLSTDVSQKELAIINKIKEFEVNISNQLNKFRSLLDSYAVNFVNYFTKLHQKTNFLFDGNKDKIKEYQIDRSLYSLSNLSGDLKSLGAKIESNFRLMMHMDSVNTRIITAALSDRFGNVQRDREIVKVDGKYVNKETYSLSSRRTNNLEYIARSTASLGAFDKAMREASGRGIQITTSNFQRGASYLNPANYFRTVSSALALATMGRVGSFYDPTRRTDNEDFFGNRRRNILGIRRGEMGMYDYEKEMEKRYDASLRGSRLMSPIFSGDIEASPILRSLVNIGRNMPGEILANRRREGRFVDYFTGDGIFKSTKGEKITSSEYFDMLRRFQTRNIDPENISGKFLGNFAPLSESLRGFTERSEEFINMIKKESKGLEGDKLNVFKSLSASLIDLGESGDVLQEKLKNLRHQFEGEDGHFDKIMEKIQILTPKEKEKFIKNYLTVDMKEMKDSEGKTISLGAGDYSSIDSNILVQRRRELQEDKQMIVNELSSGLSSESEIKHFEKLAQQHMNTPMGVNQFRHLMRQERLKMVGGTFFYGNRKNYVRADTTDMGRVRGFFENIRAGSFFQAVEEARFEEQMRRAERKDLIEKVKNATTSLMRNNRLSRMASASTGSGGVGGSSTTQGIVATSVSVSTGFLGLVLGSIVKMGVFVGKGLYTAGKFLVNALHTTFIKLKDMTVSILKKTGGVLTWLGLGLVTWYALHKANLLKHIPVLFQKTLDITKNLVNNYVLPFINSIVQFANDALTTLVSEMRVFLLTNGFYEIPRKIVDFFTNFFSGETTDGLGKTFKTFGNNVMEVGSVLLDALHQLWKGISEVFTETLWPEYLQPAFEKMSDLFVLLWENILDFFGEAVPKWWNESFVPWIDGIFNPNRSRPTQTEINSRQNSINQMEKDLEILEKTSGDLSEAKKKELEETRKKIREAKQENLSARISNNIVNPMIDATNSFVDNLKYAGYAVAAFASIHVATALRLPTVVGTGLRFLGRGGAYGVVARSAAARAAARGATPVIAGAGIRTAAAGTAGTAAAATAAGGRALAPGIGVKSGYSYNPQTGTFRNDTTGRMVRGDTAVGKIGRGGVLAPGESVKSGYRFNPATNRWVDSSGRLAARSVAVTAAPVVTAAPSVAASAASGGGIRSGFSKALRTPVGSAGVGIGGAIVGGMNIGSAYDQFSGGQYSAGVASSIGAAAGFSGHPYGLLMAITAVVGNKIADTIETHQINIQKEFLTNEKIVSHMKQELRDEVRFTMLASDEELLQRNKELTERIELYRKMVETGNMIDAEGNELTRQQIQALIENTEQLRNQNQDAIGKTATEKYNEAQKSNRGIQEQINPLTLKMKAITDIMEFLRRSDIDIEDSQINRDDLIGRIRGEKKLNYISEDLLKSIFPEIVEVTGELRSNITGQIMSEGTRTPTGNTQVSMDRLQETQNELTREVMELENQLLPSQDMSKIAVMGGIETHLGDVSEQYKHAGVRLEQAKEIAARIERGENVERADQSGVAITLQEADDKVESIRVEMENLRTKILTSTRALYEESDVVGGLRENGEHYLQELVDQFIQTYDADYLSDTGEMKQKSELKKMLESLVRMAEKRVEQNPHESTQTRKSLEEARSFLQNGRLEDYVDLTEGEFEQIGELIKELKHNTQATKENTSFGKEDFLSVIFKPLTDAFGQAKSATGATSVPPGYQHYEGEINRLRRLAIPTGASNTQTPTSGPTGPRWPFVESRRPRSGEDITDDVIDDLLFETFPGLELFEIFQPPRPQPMTEDAPSLVQEHITQKTNDIASLSQNNSMGQPQITVARAGDNVVLNVGSRESSSQAARIPGEAFRTFPPFCLA